MASQAASDWKHAPSKITSIIREGRARGRPGQYIAPRSKLYHAGRSRSAAPSGFALEAHRGGALSSVPGPGLRHAGDACHHCVARADHAADVFSELGLGLAERVDKSLPYAAATRGGVDMYSYQILTSLQETRVLSPRGVVTAGSCRTLTNMPRRRTQTNPGSCTQTGT
ncbi:hypothetical protein BC834DRAFT_911569 [Gloeopeniophorella convolvens]|nr:hypothetical protein BC834DRAFT_911569 [Gloeopeniophorella convolvens]